MVKILFVCHGNILRRAEKADKIKENWRSRRSYYTQTTHGYLNLDMTQNGMFGLEFEGSNNE